MAAIWGGHYTVLKIGLQTMEPFTFSAIRMVGALIILSVRWRLNGGPWQDIDPVVRTATDPYRVVESRAALVP